MVNTATYFSCFFSLLDYVVLGVRVIVRVCIVQ